MQEETSGEKDSTSGGRKQKAGSNKQKAVGNLPVGRQESLKQDKKS